MIRLVSMNSKSCSDQPALIVDWREEIHGTVQMLSIVVAPGPVDDIQTDLGTRFVANPIDCCDLKRLEKLEIGALCHAVAWRLVKTFI
jgi:hypothetical protein